VICCACSKPISYEEKTIAGSLWFQSWCRFLFCEECWGLGGPPWFPGACKLAEKLLAAGAFMFDEKDLPPDVRALLLPVVRGYKR
jgi:hypothetical protein